MQILEDLRAKEKSGTRFVYPVFVKKKGNPDHSLDVSLSGKSDAYIAMLETEFREFLIDDKMNNFYPSACVRASVKLEQLKSHEKAQRNGYLISSFSKVSFGRSASEFLFNNTFDAVVTDEPILRAIKSRRGQASFRNALLQAYSQTCFITGCKTEHVLEAAHIVPHGDETNYCVFNGLLLRADIHTLFDLELLSIDGF